MAAYMWYNVHQVDQVWGGWGDYNFLCKESCVSAREICQPLHKTETDHCHWSIAKFF